MTLVIIIDKIGHVGSMQSSYQLLDILLLLVAVLNCHNGCIRISTILNINCLSKVQLSLLFEHSRR